MLVGSLAWSGFVVPGRRRGPRDTPAAAGAGPRSRATRCRRSRRTGPTARREVKYEGHHDRAAVLPEQLPHLPPDDPGLEPGFRPEAPKGWTWSACSWIASRPASSENAGRVSRWYVTRQGVRPHLQAHARALHPACRRGRPGGGRGGGRAGSDSHRRALPAIARGTSRQLATRSQTRSALMPIQRERLRARASSRTPSRHRRAAATSRAGTRASAGRRTRST